MTQSEQSITGWFHALRDGNHDAAAQLWKRYFHKLSNLARRQLIHDAAYDAEDLALSVFDSLWRAAQDGRYEQLANRDELWSLLVVIAHRKMLNRRRHTSAQRRSGRNSDTAGVLHIEGCHTAIEDTDPRSRPDWEVVMAEECRHLLDLLGDRQMEQLAVLKLEGYSNGEAAEKLGMSEWALKRRLATIRKRWEGELP